jgi:DNA replicative helicase MCM subunit Mcm2 (Cdc46/Mcm family)
MTTVNRYVKFRKTMKEHKKTTGAQVIPITVRQLEAIIRISESLAR